MFLKNVAAVASYYPFKKLIALYGMPNPFDEGSFKEVTMMLKKVIEKTCKIMTRAKEKAYKNKRK